jgi:hypothetical protein
MSATSTQARDALTFTPLIWFNDGDGNVTAAFANVLDARAWAASHNRDFVHFSMGSALAANFAITESRSWWEERFAAGLQLFGSWMASRQAA